MRHTPPRPLFRAALPLVAGLGLAALLSGCVAYPAYPDYGYNGYYGYGPAYGYPGGGYLAFGTGWGRHDNDWHGGHEMHGDHDWRR